ncbi:hypothetical protein N9J72_00020 [Candidatus Gracilibacteria bacterium]|nr:hypothetical protein [Candidatus Gracilibacteria bacterium]
MDFFSSLLAIALPHGFTEDQVTQIHKNYCENLYFQPDAIQKMQDAECNIYEVDEEITRVNSGRY